MGQFTEEVGGFQERAHGGGELRGSGQDNAEEFFRCTAIGRLTFPLAIKGLRPAEHVFLGEIVSPYPQERASHSLSQHMDLVSG
jgi:hypothetical protein